MQTLPVAGKMRNDDTPIVAKLQAAMEGSLSSPNRSVITVILKASKAPGSQLNVGWVVV